LEVECASPDADPCRDEDFALGLADEMIYVGGKKDVR
jgi:hypothetical protein